MSDLISRRALCEYALNQKGKSVTPNDIIRFPSAQPEKRTEERTETHACDCISRQDAIRIVDGIDTWQAGWRGDAIESIKALPPTHPDLSEYSDKLWKAAYERGKAEAQQRWIPCSERLPAYGEDVLISIGGYCNVGHIVSVNEEEQYNWYFSGWYHLPNDVVAWMPLPEPYAERRTDDSD